ncbi:hypothetical protein OAQ99_07775 [Candidatus Kapabacteria bacterium]|nr:hypothetical protein [Candidatus Kapabacteria bacterium]
MMNYDEFQYYGGFDEYDDGLDNNDVEIVEETLEELIEYALRCMDPKFELYDFVVDRLKNLEGEYERSNTVVLYFERTDLDRDKWKFCYNLIVPIAVAREEFDEEEPKIVKTIMLDILRNSDLIKDSKPNLKGDLISRESIQIGGIEKFFLGLPNINIKL